MTTFNQILQKNCTSSHNELAFRLVHQEKYEDLTYGALEEHSWRFACAYRNKGVKQGDIVLIILPHGKDVLCSFIGACMIGAIPSYMPQSSSKQHPQLYLDSMQKLSERIQAKLIVMDEQLPIRGNIFQTFELGTLEGKPHWTETKETDIVLLQHSSGTTGLKKGVTLNNKAVVNQVQTYAKVLHLGSKDCIVSWLPLYHDMGLITSLLLPVLMKVPVVMMSPFEWVIQPEMLLREIEKNKGTLCWLPNFAFNFIAQQSKKQYDLSSMKAFISCSEPCKYSSMIQFQEKLAVSAEKCSTCYAMAENVFAVTQEPIGHPVHVDMIDPTKLSDEHIAFSSKKENALRVLSVGQLISNTKLKVVDDARHGLPERSVGEIAISGESLFSEYFKEPEQTAKVCSDGWYYTGDLGYVADNRLYITGRKKDLLIVNGKNYYAHDIEEYVNLCNGIKKGRCVAIGIENVQHGSEEVVVIAETEASEAEHAEIRRNIKMTIRNAVGLVVKDVVLVPLKWLVKTTSGKISRSDNKARYLTELVKK